MSLTQREFDRHLPRSAVKGHGDCVARLMAIHDLGNILRVGHPVLVNGHDQVATQVDGCVAQVGLLRASAQPGAFRGSSGITFCTRTP